MGDLELEHAWRAVEDAPGSVEAWGELTRRVLRSGRLPAGFDPTWGIERILEVWGRAPGERHLEALFLRCFGWGPNRRKSGTPGARWVAEERLGKARSGPYDLLLGVPLRVRVPGLAAELRWIPPGNFTMGTAGGAADEAPSHSVEIARGFFMATTPVTQRQYRRVIGENPSAHRGNGKPVEQVSWREAVMFCRTLTARERRDGGLPAGWEYRLPSEAEWEYACRAGSRRDPGDPASIAWCAESAEGATREVGTKPANGWGLRDILGNVHEWCLDGYRRGYTSATGDARAYARPTQARRVRRGGSYCSPGEEIRAGRRWDGREDRRFEDTGFRVVATRRDGWAAAAMEFQETRDEQEDLVSWSELFDP